MTNVSVKSVSGFFDVAVSTKSGVQMENNGDSFDKTLNEMRTEKTDKDNECKNQSSKTVGASEKSDKFKSVNCKEKINQEDEVTDEQVAAASEEVLSQMKELLMDKYNISEEQLSATIEDLGLSEESILNANELIQIVMRLEGLGSQADVLTNPDFAKNLKEILSELEDLRNGQTFEYAHVDDMNLDVMEKDVKTDDNDATTDVTQDFLQQTTVDENLTTNENNSDGMFKQNDSKEELADVQTQTTNVNVNPHDLVLKLTEDLSAKVGEVKANDIVRQVVEQTQLQVKQGVTSLEMQLYPEHLGKVLVQVVSNEGSITAQITAESEAAKTALESQLTLLKENLINQGIKVENVEVTIASHAFEQNMQGQADNEQSSGQNKRSRRNNNMFFDETDNESIQETEQNVMELKGSTVSYLA